MRTDWRKPLCCWLVPAVLAAPPSGTAVAGDRAAWADDEETWRARAAAVNEGDLDFLAGAPDGPVHHHHSRIVISERSLIDGWVVLEQCHVNLDRVPAAQIVFNPERSRALAVTSVRNIERAFAEGNTIQLQGIGVHSRVCVRAESLALRRPETDVFELVNGPFMRRFLDGYYPLRLSLRIEHPPTIALADFSPVAQPGFSVTQAPGHVAVEALFEGQLHTRFRFLAD
jgi:hypothetical protein